MTNSDMSIECDVKGESRLRGQRYSAKDQGGRYAEERRLPSPYPSERFLKPWEPLTRDVGKIPAVDGRDLSRGGGRLSPQNISIYTDVQPRSKDETPKPWVPTKVELEISGKLFDGTEWHGIGKIKIFIPIPET